MFIADNNSSLKGNCSSPAEVKGGQWTCYNGRVCKLKSIELKRNCYGKIKCVNQTWIIQPNKIIPSCGNVLTSSEDLLELPMTINSIFGLLAMIIGSLCGYGFKKCNLRSMKYSITEEKQRYKENELTIDEGWPTLPRSMNVLNFDSDEHRKPTTDLNGIHSVDAVSEEMKKLKISGKDTFI